MSSSPDCPEQRLWKKLLAGKSPEEEQPRLIGHLDSCPDCRHKLSELSGESGALPQDPNPFGPEEQALEPHLAAAIMDLKSSVFSGRTRPPEPGENETLVNFLDPSTRPGYLGVLGPYPIVETIGRGGMGIVLKGYDASLERVVAVKVLAPQLANSHTARKRFLREARAAAAVIHEHVVPIYAVDEDSGLPYLVMQYVAGNSLQQEIDLLGMLPVEEIVRIGAQIAEGLAAASEKGIVHRDIKPANILLEGSRKIVKIADFGLARAGIDARITDSESLAGSPQYMAPEQCRGERVDQRSDLYSFGCVLYAMGAGHPPFQSDTLPSLIDQVCNQNPTSIRELNPAIPQWLSVIVERLLAKAPEDRIQSADEIAHMLRVQIPPVSIIESEREQIKRQITVGPPSHKPRRVVTRLLMMLLGVLLVFGVAVVTEIAGVTSLIGMFAGPQKPPEPLPDGEPDGSLDPHGTPRPDHGILVLGAGGRVRVFETVQRAIDAAADGDVIEIRMRQAIPVRPMQIHGRSLTIRAGHGFRPVLTVRDEGKPLIETDSPLVLEGLVLQNDLRAPESPGNAKTRSRPKLRNGRVIVSHGASLHMANCRIALLHRRTVGGACLELEGSEESEIVNSIILCAAATGIRWVSDRGGNLTLKNVICSGRSAVDVESMQASANIRIDRSTFVASSAIHLLLPDKPLGETLYVQSAENVFDVRVLLSGSTTPGTSRPPEMKDRFRRIMTWSDERDLFPNEAGLIGFLASNRTPLVIGFSEWNQYWGKPDTGSRHAPIKLHPQLPADPEKTRPEHFRLASTQGADTAMVGAGDAYDRWRETPDYRSWIATTYSRTPGHEAQ